MMEKMSKYRVDDDWINCEMAYLKKRMKFDDSDAVLTTETSVPILFALLEEIKARRESDTSGGVTMERVTDERIADILDGLIYNKHNVIEALKELQARRKAEKEQGHTDNSASEKDSAEATRKRENEINVSWNKIAMNYSHCPYIMFPATDGDDCGSWEGIYAASLRKKYESIAGIPPKNSKEMVLPAPVKHVDGVDVKTGTVKIGSRKSMRNWTN